MSCSVKIVWLDSAFIRCPRAKAGLGVGVTKCQASMPGRAGSILFWAATYASGLPFGHVVITNNSKAHFIGSSIVFPVRVIKTI